MRRLSATVAAVALALIVGLVVPVLTNVATYRLPAWLEPYTWVALLVAGGLVAAGTILARVQTGTPRPDANPRSPRTPTVPRTLRPALTEFTGRAPQFAALDDAVRDAARAHRAAAVVAVVTGMPGVGKSALALQWAHARSGRFGDGQLYFDFRGYAPQTPATPDEAAAVFLAALGVPPGELPTSGTARLAALRSLLSRGRVLMLLDNVSAADQIRPLLPANSRSLVLVTSRETLDSLPENPVRVRLDPMPDEDAVRLLRTTLAGRAVNAPEYRRLAHLCGNLPLALWVAGRRIAVRTDVPVADSIRELDDERRRLGALAIGRDPQASLRTVLSWSYARLAAVDPAAARLFRLLGVHPGATYGTGAVAALADHDADETGRLLATLASAHLVERRGPGRVGQHDLLRLYAAELAATDPAGRSAAIDRCVRWYLATAAAADRVITPTRPPRPITAPPPGPPVEFADRAAAIDWFETERVNLVAATEAAAVDGPAEVAYELPGIAVPFYQLRKHWADWIRTHEIALAAARRSGDARQVHRATQNLAVGFAETRRFDRALELYRDALRMAEESGTAELVASATYMLGNTLQELRRFDEAAGRFRTAIDLAGVSGLPYHAAIFRVALADDYRELGRHDEALELLEASVAALAGVDGLRAYETLARWALAVSLREAGRPADAIGQATTAAGLARADQDRYHEGLAALCEAASRSDLGEHAAASRSFAAALEIFEQLGDRFQAGVTQAQWARALAPVNRPAARERGARALALLAEYEDPQARHEAATLARDLQRDPEPHPAHHPEHHHPQPGPGR